MYGTHLFSLLNVSQAGLELVVAAETVVAGGGGSPKVFSV
jgi:hypothetical protein